MMQAHAQTQALAEGLASAAPSTRWGRVVWLLLIVLMAAVVLAGFALCEWLVVQAAIYGWQTSNWNRLDFGFVTPLPFLFSIFLPLFFAMQPGVRPELTRSILDALAHGDVALAPPAARQPEPVHYATEGQLVTLHLLRRATIRDLQWRGMILTFVMIPIEYWALTFALSELLGADNSSAKLFGLSLSDVALIVTSASLISALVEIALLAGSSLRRLHITADETGISFHSGRRLRHASLVRWDQVRAFYRMEYIAWTASLRRIYIVDVGDRIFAWVIGAAASIGQLNESEALAGIITERTRLPLRDISELALKAQQYQQLPHEMLRMGLTPDAMAALQRLMRLPLRWVFRFGVFYLLFIVIVLLVPLVGEQRLEDYQRGYFASLPQKIHAETPIYFDSLAASDNQWDVEQPSKDNGEWNIGFRDGTYQLTGKSGNIVDSSPDRVFRDAAIEVTAVQRGKAADGNDGVGLLLRADTDNNMVVFVVSPTDGSWWLSHDYYYNPAHPNDSWYSMDGGTSGFVHTGAGATNTLLVLARGPTYLLYVNGHFLDAYTDRYHEDPHPVFSGNGNAGVYVNDGATTGIFSNFSVYPVQSPPSLSYV